MSYIPEPVTRTDKYLAYIAGNMDVALPDHPITRKEHYLAAWAEKSGFEDVDVAGEPPLTLENAIGKPLKGMKVYGKSKQVTTTGAQLFPPPNLGSQEKNGITIDCLEEGKIRISGTAEILTDFYVSRLQLSAGTYTFSAGVNIDASTLCYALVDDIGVPYYDVNGDYTTDAIKETIEVELLLRVYAGKTIDLTVQPMLNVGSTPLPWEPYTGGLPSPSPDYPQEIESVGMKWSTGANLLDISQWSAYEKTYGLTMTIDEDGYFQLDGTYDNDAGAGNIGNCMFRFLRTSPGTVFPDGVKFAGGMMETSENVSDLRFLCTGLSENTPCLVIAFSAVNGENIKIRFRPMLYVGDITPDWEPYTGGAPKPYGDKIEVNVHGKNLIPFPYPLLGGAGTKTELNGVTYTVQEDGGVRCIGTPNSVFGVSLSMIRFSDKHLSVGGPTDGKVVLSGGPLYFDSSNKKLFFFFDTKQVGNPIDTVIYPQIELGTVATPYEPYHEPKFASIATPNGLPGIQVASGGDYTDADGQQWVCDEIDFGRGVYVQRVAYTTVDGDRIIFKETGNYWNLPRYSSPGCIYAYNHINTSFSSSVFRSNNNHSFIFTTPEWMKEYFDTVDKLNEFCKTQYDAGTPLTLYYTLATPIETPLTDEQIAAYKQLHTYKGTTIIDNDAGAYMSVRYEKMK